MTIVALLAVVSLVLLVLLIRSARRSRELREFVDDLRWGNYGRRLYLKGDDSYSRMMRDLSSIAEQLEERTREADELRRRLSTILRKIPDGLVLLDEKDRVKLANPLFETLFGRKESELMEKEIALIADIPELVALLREAREGGSKMAAGEFATEEGRQIRTMVMPFTVSDGWYGGAVVVFRDVTAEKRIDQVRKDFVANVSHELKTPVTVIKGYTETLLEGVEGPEDSRRFLEVIRFQSGRMERLVGDLITLSKIELGAMPFEKRPVSLGPLTDEVFRGFEGAASEKGISFRKDIGEPCAEIEADPGHLEQILVNLVDNAVKYTDSGSVTVRARRDQSGRCVVSVQDTGIGVPRKYLGRLGERFFRVDPSRSRDLGGTGLGLAIVKHLVKAHGWKMSFESDSGKGTTVNILTS
jgi:two-component system phosphate regulon sensor histidine kinase PhoR